MKLTINYEWDSHRSAMNLKRWALAIGIYLGVWVLVLVGTLIGSYVLKFPSEWAFPTANGAVVGYFLAKP